MSTSGPDRSIIRKKKELEDMLAICEERFQWQRKKEAEFYSRRYHQMLRENSGML